MADVGLGAGGGDEFEGGHDGGGAGVSDVLVDEVTEFPGEVAVNFAPGRVAEGGLDIVNIGFELWVFWRGFLVCGEGLVSATGAGPSPAPRTPASRGRPPRSTPSRSSATPTPVGCTRTPPVTRARCRRRNPPTSCRPRPRSRRASARGGWSRLWTPTGRRRQRQSSRSNFLSAIYLIPEYIFKLRDRKSVV